MNMKTERKDCISAQTATQVAVDEVLPLSSSYLLPHDLILEILSRLPPENIVRFRCVCKLWFSTLADSKFIQQHRCNHRKNDTASRIVIPTDMIGATLQQVVLVPDYNTETNKMTDNRKKWPCLHWRILGTCNGLFCYETEGSVMLCNPSIHRTIPLPTCSLVKDINCYYTDTEHGFSWGIGFDEVKDDYKVVVIRSKVPSSREGKAVIFSLNSNSWKIFEGVIPVMWTFCASFFLHGFIHWVSWVEPPNGHRKICLAVFDVSKEVFGEMSLPFDKNVGHVVISVLKGWVCAVKRGENNNGWEVWTMNEYGVEESWGMRYRVNGDELPGVNSPSYIPLVSFGGYLFHTHGDHQSDHTIRNGPYHQYYYSNYSTLDVSDFPTVRDYWRWHWKHKDLPHQHVIYDFKTGKYSNVCRTRCEVNDVIFVEATLDLINHAII